MNPIFFAMLWQWMRGGRKAGLTILLACAIWSPADAAIHRSSSVKVAFMKTHACPSTGLFKLPCPGYVLDHKKALACGGRDSVANLQLQTIAEGKAKDKIERIGCKNGRRL